MNDEEKRLGQARKDVRLWEKEVVRCRYDATSTYKELWFARNMLHLAKRHLIDFEKAIKTDWEELDDIPF